MFEAFTQLIEQNYEVKAASLESIHRFESDVRGVYKVEQPIGPGLLLRAIRAGTLAREDLTGIAGALEALAAAGYRAPLVQRTRSNALVAEHDGWLALLLTYVEGELISGCVDDMTAMGEVLAQLHVLSPDELRRARPVVPDGRYHPKEKLKPWLDDLEAAAERIPAELDSRYESCIQTVTNVLAWPELPISLLHSDCNPQNAIKSQNDEVTFIDWDGVGFGPAVTDLAYLLFHCHIVQTSWPLIEPSQEWINAILRGYEQHRPLSTPEIEHLHDAIALAECRHLAQRLPKAVRADWREDRGLTRFHGRELLVDPIAEIALAYYEETSR